MSNITEHDLKDYSDWNVLDRIEAEALYVLNDYEDEIDTLPEASEISIYCANLVIEKIEEYRRDILINKIDAIDWLDRGFKLAFLNDRMMAEQVEDSAWEIDQSNRQSVIASKPRIRSSMARSVLRHLSPDVRTAKQFSNYVGRGICIVELTIEITPMLDLDGKLITYQFRQVKTGKISRMSPASIPKTISQIRS